MKTTKITINSLFGIDHLELDGKPVELIGAKGTGKTSVIDSIKYALTNRSDRDYIVKQGAREGSITIETDTGLSIARKKRTDTGDYNKITEFGKPVASPQSFINDIFTPLQLNPVEFASWDKNKQNRAILDLIEFQIDTVEWIKEKFGELPRGVDYSQHILQVLEDIQAKNGSYYLEREDLNRKELYKRQSITDIAVTIPKGYDLEKWDNYSLSDKIKELQTLQKANSEIDRAIEFIKAYNNKVSGFKAEKEISISSEEQAITSEREGLKSTNERLKAELKANEEKLLTLDSKLADKKKIAQAEYDTKVAKLESDVEVARKYENKAKVDISALNEEIQEAESMKKYISEYKSMLDMKAECENLKAESDELTRKIVLARELPGIVLETATIPVDGLTVKNGLPLISGLPVSNLSGGELIELCTDITISKECNLQLILIDGAEALDDISRTKLYEKCKNKGLQVIATRTTNDAEFTIVEL